MPWCSREGMPLEGMLTGRTPVRTQRGSAAVPPTEPLPDRQFRGRSVAAGRISSGQPPDPVADFGHVITDTFRPPVLPLLVNRIDPQTVPPSVSGPGELVPSRHFREIGSQNGVPGRIVTFYIAVGSSRELLERFHLGGIGQGVVTCLPGKIESVLFPTLIPHKRTPQTIMLK